MEELGRSVAPVPFLGSSVLAVAALLDLSVVMRRRRRENPRR
jgi:hypothetical protein